MHADKDEPRRFNLLAGLGQRLRLAAQIGEAGLEASVACIADLAESGEALPDTAGELVTASGEVIGEHTGIHNFTVGQRKGLGVATGSPLYVIQINGADKQVVVGSDEHLYSRTLRARRVNLISVDDLREPLRVSVKIRHRHEATPAVLEKIASDEVLVTFDQPQRAITPGQAAVFYAGDVVVGGAWIA